MNLFMAGNRGKWGSQLNWFARSATIFIAPFSVVVPLSTAPHEAGRRFYPFTSDSLSQSIARLEKLNGARSLEISVRAVAFVI